MIKKYYDITIRDFNLIETTGRINHLNKTILPTILFKGAIAKQLNEIAKILNQSADDDSEQLKWKLQSLTKINAIEACYLGIVNSFNLGMKVTSFSYLMARRFRRKIKSPSNNVKTYIESIKKYTGIEVKEYKDLEKVRKELTFRKDKFNEHFREQNKSESKVYLMSVVLGVFSYLNQPINLDMTILEFARIREDALDKMRKEKANGRG